MPVRPGVLKEGVGVWPLTDVVRNPTGLMGVVFRKMNRQKQSDGNVDVCTGSSWRKD